MGFTSVVTAAGLRLFARLASKVEEAARATLVRLPMAAGAVTTKLRFVVAPAAKVPRLVHTTELPTNVPPPAAMRKVAPVGTASVTDNAAAAEGPAFVTVML